MTILKTATERPRDLARRVYRKVKPVQKATIGDVTIERTARSIVVSPPGADRSIGMYLYGGCDTQRLLSLGDRIGPAIEETLALTFKAGISSGRVDLMLQQLGEVPAATAKEIVERLNLRARYFEPELFEPTFADPRILGGTPVTKDIIVLNLGASVVRTAYRHKESGLLVDPGGWWLDQSYGNVKSDKTTMKWFRSNFESVGRVDLDQWEQQFRTLHAEITERTGAQLMVLGLLTVEPGDPTHSYVGRNAPETVRRRRFHIRLMQLADELGFSVIDVDRILKEASVEGFVDFAHMPKEHFDPVIDEVIHLMAQQDLGTIDLEQLAPIDDTPDFSEAAIQ